MGLLRRVENRWSEAKVELERAIVLDRNNTWAIRQLGQALVFMGQPEAAIPHLDKVLRLNPREASLAVTYAFFGWIHIFLDHMDEAMNFFRKARAENPRLWYTHLWFAGAMGLRGDMDEARTEIAESLRLKPELDSLARIRALPSFGNPQLNALMEKTFYVGLRRAGFPDE